MAPILTNATGVIPQKLDDPRLQQLLTRLNEMVLPAGADLYSGKLPNLDTTSSFVQQLADLLSPWQEWIFDEQVDLHDWIHPLNLIDISLRWSLATYPALLLIAPVERRRGRASVALLHPVHDAAIAESMLDVQTISSDVLLQLLILLRFSSSLLRNATSKSIYNSVEELADLLACFDDEVADGALSALQALSLPPALHKQQAPEAHQITTALHNSKTDTHSRLTCTARGWGTRAMGLGLYLTATADDSVHGQGSLPPEAGQVHFCYYNPEMSDVLEGDNLIRIALSDQEMISPSDSASPAEENSMTIENLDETIPDAGEASKKRRRVGPTAQAARKVLRSTADMFFCVLQKAGGRSKIPADRLFSLLADIRLARSFHCHATRVAAVERRLRALVCILYSHPSQEIMSGYFQAQPELCVEIVDLLRPTVSSANVSAASARTVDSALESSPLHQDAIAGLSNSQTVPYSVRMLALEALTALVSRRDGTTGNLSGSARLSIVLTELGVGKGQYLGLLPTLIRYSLASLGSIVHSSSGESNSNAKQDISRSTEAALDSEAFDIGLAFVEATMAPLPPRMVQVERALEFIDNVLTLTSAVVATPTGTSALTDCGLIPALLTTVALDADAVLNRLLPDSSRYSHEEIRRIQALLQFIVAQAVQILEGAITTHNNAQTAFHDLRGVDVLTNRLSREITSTENTWGRSENKTLSANPDAMDVDPPVSTSQPDPNVEAAAAAGGNAEAEATARENVKSAEGECRIQSSQRILLFSIITCLTVVFHQDATTSSASTPSGGAQVRKKELTDALIRVMEDVESYGGHLASLFATLLSDVMNSDPHVVHYVHKSGIAAAFLNMVIGKKIESADGKVEYQPILPAVPELIMAVPSVLSALALTDDGAKAIQDANPFPALLRLLYHPDYAMPKSRCLLNELTAIIGTGLDEIMRHVDRLKPLVLQAITDALREVVRYGEDLARRENEVFNSPSFTGSVDGRIEDERSCLVQYVLNFGQLLDQILHNEDHCEPFVEAGGLDALMQLFPAAMPRGYQFLTHVSCLSSPSVSTLHHSTVEDTLSLVFKCIFESRYDSLKLIRTLSSTALVHLDRLSESRQLLVGENETPFILDALPREPLYRITSATLLMQSKALSDFLRDVAIVQWITCLLASAIKSVTVRNQDSGTAWNRSEREWEKELSTEAFESLVTRLAAFHQSSIFEVCRIRTEPGYEEREKERLVTRIPRLRYRLRIVCPEGAVVRDGIEIDSCTSVGNMEMGEIVEAFDRCINSSGILRYRTRRGWVSEMTRGHGREPIAEAICLYESAELELPESAQSNRRVEAVIPDLRNVAAGVLARVQNSYAELFSSISKVVVQSVRTLTTRAISFEEGSQGAHVSATMKILAVCLKRGFNDPNIAAVVHASHPGASQNVISSGGTAMYLGCMLSHVQVCLFDEKRERRIVNFPLLVNIVSSDQSCQNLYGLPEDLERNNVDCRPVGLLDAVRFVFSSGLSDFAEREMLQQTRLSKNSASDVNEKRPTQRISRTVAASVPPLITFLRRLMSTPLSSSPVASVMSRIKWKDIPVLLGEKDLRLAFTVSPMNDDFFQPESFGRGLQLVLSKVVKEVWSDPRFIRAPPYLIHPITSMVSDIMVGLEDAAKKKPPGDAHPVRGSNRTLLSDWIRERRRQDMEAEAAAENFEPDEDAVLRLTEMGFNREHALDAIESTQSNQLEVAMEYALSHTPPSPSAIERRRAERAERARRREANLALASGSEPQPPVANGNVPVESGVTQNAINETNDTTSANAMDIEAKETSEGEAEKKTADTGPSENGCDDVARAKDELISWSDLAPKVCCDLLAGVQPPGQGLFDAQVAGDSKSLSHGDGESEALTVVVSSFLLDLCHRYPDKRLKIVSRVLDELKKQLVEQMEVLGNGDMSVSTSKANIAALVHAAALFARALPNTRLLVLHRDLTSNLVSCVKGFVRSGIEGDWKQTIWPIWLAPTLLLLDIMAQPVVAFADEELINSMVEEGQISFSPNSELSQVRAEHKAQGTAISKAADSMFRPLSARQEEELDENRIGQDPAADSITKEEGRMDAEKQEHTSPFDSVPAYFPLLPMSTVDCCLDICLSLLGSKGGDSLSGKIAPPPPPPGVTQALLMLLLRLLRSPKISSNCLRLGVAEAILALPSQCKFTGNTGLVTMIFRRLLEDDITLQAAMETEIKSAVTKLYAKQKQSTKNDMPTTSLSSYIDGVMPLICRDPFTFLRAMFLSVRVEQSSSSESKDAKVVLLSAEERALKVNAVSDISKTPVSDAASKQGAHSPAKSRQISNGPHSKVKQPHKSSRRVSSAKKTKREKNEPAKGPSQSSMPPVSTPASHLTCLLVNKILVQLTSSASQVSDAGLCEDQCFLWTGNLLEMLADLVLAVPACASAVHNYRPHRSKKEKSSRLSLNSYLCHALAGCPSPPKTFVSYLLHVMLPQDRWSIRNDPQIWERRKEDAEKDAEVVKAKKKKAYQLTRISQAAARVFVALAARPGEGRKRVMSDLTFALSGGRLGHGSEIVDVSRLQGEKAVPSKSELHALHAWGELCLGLAAPRNNGKILEGTSLLSVENIKLMLENGMAHALLYAIQRVRLFHPMASTTCSSLLLPFEVLTRTSVTDAVKSLIEEGLNSKNAVEAERSELATRGPTVEDGANHSSRNTSGEDIGHFDSDGTDHYPGAPVDFENMGAEDDGVGDPEMMEMDDEERDGEEEISSNEESDDEPSEEEESESEMDEDGDDESELEESEEVPSEEVDDEGGWNVDYQEPLGADNPAEQHDMDEVDDEGTDNVDQDLDEGWARIDSSGFGGMFLGGWGRRNAFPVNPGDASSRTRGFIDAAEAMIGTLLRTGEISSDALAEIEGTLGIRLSARRATGASIGDGGNGVGDSLATRMMGGGASQVETRRGEVMGTLPHIHQRSQPDVGYLAFGNGGRWVEVSSMEYVFGGPSVTAGSRNYDLISPIQSDIENDAYLNLSQLDLQLFPGGPAAAASARTQHSLHPLLCGVDLPPVNSLVSDLLPHGIRATRRGQMTTRRHSDWTSSSFAHGSYLVSTSNGNIIRSNRPHTVPGTALSVPRVDGPVGWTDDGLPFDGTIDAFSTAFERALRESALPQQPTASRDLVTDPSQGTGRTEPTVEGHAPASQELNNHSSTAEPDEIHADSSPSAGSEGDRVASSLAEGLRLSPRSEDEAGSDLMSTGNTGRDGIASIERSSSVPPDGIMLEAHEDGSRNVNPDTDIQQREQVEDNPDIQQREQVDDNAEEVHVAPADVESQVVPEANGEHQNETQNITVERVEEGNEGVSQETTDERRQPNANGLVCPPDIDLEVFNSLPVEMQQDCVDQFNATQEIAAQLDGSTLDPDFLAALPEEMRREIIEQERRERLREQQQEPPAGTPPAAEMDNASFLASLVPELREEILLTADDAFLNSLPPHIVAEAHLLRERASAQHRRGYDEAVDNAGIDGTREGGAAETALHRVPQPNHSSEGGSSRRRHRMGKLRVELDRDQIVYLPDTLSPPLSKSDLKVFMRLMYLVSPMRPRLLQKILQNLCINSVLRTVISTVFVKLLHEDGEGALATIDGYGDTYSERDDWRRTMDELFYASTEFPPSNLLGASPDLPDAEAFNLSVSASLLRRKPRLGNSSLPAANQGRRSCTEASLPPVVAARIIDTILQLSKSSMRFSLHTLVSPIDENGSTGEKSTCFDKLLDLLDHPMYAKSSANLDQLLTLLESLVSPLSFLPKHHEEEMEISQRDVDAAAAASKEWVDVPRVTVSQSRLQLLCSILRMETCRETASTKVNTIVRRLCRIETNRGYVLAELATVAHGLGADALRDLRSLRIRMDDAVQHHQHQFLKIQADEQGDSTATSVVQKPGLGMAGAISSSVTLSTSTSELKLLRVLLTLQALCGDNPDDSNSKKNEGSVVVTDELLNLLMQMNFDELWDELSACLKVVQVLEGVTTFNDDDDKTSEEVETNDDVSNDENAAAKGKKLRNSAAGLLTRFLPSIEAFFVANASATRLKDKTDKTDPSSASQEIVLENLVGGKRLMEFVSANKVLLNALIRNNPGLLEKGLRAMVQVSRCRVFLDFDVKRQWFKTQMRRLRQQASRRHGSLRLVINRKNVFEDAYQHLRLRNVDEMRGRLHITFRNEEGVDAGGLSREFFGILAKEIFNPNYALFTSTEDGCTFQPNPNSSINPDHLSYFRFVGRIVGKAVADGYLLDAHFTRSLYKHMLGMEPTHHDMEAIDPDYYRNLKTILEYNLADIGLELTFSIEDHSFGRSQVKDLVPNGRTIPVTEENKEEYVRLVCQHRMTTAIQSQIKAYLDGFYELVNPELVRIFTPRELELLISGLPDIDVHDLKKNTDYVGYKATDKEIGWFWNIMFSLSRNEKASFLQFVTGSSKVPLSGFAELQGMRGVQKFSIHRTTGIKGSLMSAHTCFNSLDLPVYSSEEEMREKLLYAINEGGGGFLFA